MCERSVCQRPPELPPPGQCFRIDASQPFRAPSASTGFFAGAITADPGVMVCAWQPITLDAGPFAAYLRTMGETTQTMAPEVTGLYGVSVTDKNGCFSWDSLEESIGVGEGHTLSRLANLAFNECGIAAIDLSQLTPLLSGDLHTDIIPQDNLVDIVDFTILAAAWGVPVDPNQNAGADVNGGGLQDTADFVTFLINYFLVGDPTNGSENAVANPQSILRHPES